MDLVAGMVLAGVLLSFALPAANTWFNEGRTLEMQLLLRHGIPAQIQYSADHPDGEFTGQESELGEYGYPLSEEVNVDWSPHPLSPNESFVAVADRPNTDTVCWVAYGNWATEDAGRVICRVGSVDIAPSWPEGLDDPADWPDPQTMADCMQGGWVNYGFTNQGLCIRFVQTGKDRRIGE